MDAEHRHELKSNELVDFLGHLPEFFRKYSNQIIGITLIIVALVVIPLYNRMRRQTDAAEKAAMVSKIQMGREALAAAVRDTEGENPLASLITAIEDLDEAAQTTDYADLAALALLEESELLRAQLHIQSEVSADTVSANLSKARTACEQAFEKAKSPTLKGLAELGLGLCAEEAGEYDKAREIYEAVVAKSEYAGTGVIEQVKRRLDSLDDNAQKVVFVPALEEPTTEVEPEAPLQESIPQMSEVPSIQAVEPAASAAESTTP